jgi:hypothetical protein
MVSKLISDKNVPVNSLKLSPYFIISGRKVTIPGKRVRTRRDISIEKRYGKVFLNISSIGISLA